MGDNNIVRGVVTGREGERLVDERAARARERVRPARRHDVGSPATIAIRAAAVTVGRVARQTASNSAECEIVFVEFLGDLVKLHLQRQAPSGCSPRSPPSTTHPAGRRTAIRISWKEEDVQLLDA